jgi:hypothetical protein
LALYLVFGLHLMLGTLPLQIQHVQNMDAQPLAANSGRKRQVGERRCRIRVIIREARVDNRLQVPPS